MRKPLMRLLVFVTISLIMLLTGCETCEETSYVLPPDLPVPELLNTDDPKDIERDYITLVGQDLRWRMLMASSRLIIGEISQEEYDIITEDLLRRLGEE